MVARVILDTNVLVAAARSRRGASYRVLSLVGTGAFEICLSVPLVLEYEATLLRQLDELSIGRRDVGKLLDYIAAIAQHQEIFFLWRPQLRDPKDDMVLELAVAARADYVVTYNVCDFRGAGRFRVNIMKPVSFLAQLGEGK